MYFQVRFDTTYFCDADGLDKALETGLLSAVLGPDLRERPSFHVTDDTWVPMATLYDGTSFGRGTIEFVLDASQGTPRAFDLACRRVLASLRDDARIHAGRLFLWDDQAGGVQPPSAAARRLGAS